MNIIELLESGSYVEKPDMFYGSTLSILDRVGRDEEVKRYLHMLKCLHNICPEAAQWILDNEPVCDEYSRVVSGADITYDNVLIGIMYWGVTPQGHAYWSILHNKLEDAEFELSFDKSKINFVRSGE